MRPSSLRGIVVATWFVLVTSIAGAQEEPRKKPLAIKDLYLLESARSPTLFSNDEKLVYERAWIDAKTKMDRHALWLVTEKRENRKPLEEGEPDGRSPVVSPDGKWVAFLSARPRPNGWKQTPRAASYSDATVDLWIIPSSGGTAVPLGGPQKPWGRVFHDGFYGRVAFSPDSSKLVFVADDGADPRTAEEIENDVEIVRPDQGEGYTGYGAAQVWIAELDRRAESGPDGRAESRERPGTAAATSVTRLTNDDVWYGDPQWSPDGKTIVVHANKTKDRESVRFSINKNFDLYAIDVASKQQTQLTTNPGADIAPRFSPDGKQIAYLSCPRKGPHRDAYNLCVIDLGAGVPRSRILWNQHQTNATQQVAPSFPWPNVCWTSSDPSDPGLLRINSEEGVITPIVHLIDPKTGRRWIANERAMRYTTDVRYIPYSNSFVEKRLVGSSMVVSWKNEEFEIEGIFTTPPAEVAKPPYRLIVYPHGGPHSRATLGFDFTVQLFAAQGYAVFQPNFRGSSGYGRKFIDADRFDLGGGDMRDILSGIDMLVKTGKVDPKRQFVYGISYGGFMTSWLVGHTNQFRAAVAQNAVTDMNMMYGLSDLQSWTHWELGGAPWQQPDRYRKHSPLTYADKVKTPTLILHARDDRRCPLPMGKAFYQALLANDVPTQMVIYPNEGHGIRQPRHREDVYRRVLAWFEKYAVR